MGSQPSSLDSDRQLKGFIITKQLNARRKLKPLSKKFSDSDIFTLIEHNENEFSGNQNRRSDGKLKRPQSEKVRRLSGISDHTEPNLSNLKTPNPVINFSNKSEKPLNQKISSKSTTVNVNGSIAKTITMDKKLKTKEAGSFEHLDHWVHKNEPYVQKSDIPHSQQEKPIKDGKKKSSVTEPDSCDKYSSVNNVDNDDEDNEPNLPEKDFEQRKKERVEEVKKALAGIKIHHQDRTPEGYFTEAFRNDVLTVYKTYFAFQKCLLKMRIEFRMEVAEEFLHPDNNTVSIFCNLIQIVLGKGYRNSEGKPIAALFRPVKNMVFHLQNTTDFHQLCCLKVMEQPEYISFLIQKLKEMSEPHLMKELKENDNILLRGMMGTLHNVSQIEENTAKLRELNIIDAVKPYLESHNEMLQLGSLATLADIVNEEESEILRSNDKFITFIVKSLRCAMKDKMRRSHGWSVREIARTIHMVAKNDNNKRTVLTQGAVPLLVELAEKSTCVEEQREAVGALLTLSFDEQNKTEIVDGNDSKVIDTFYKLHESDDAEVRKTCTTALWMMRDHLKSSKHDHYKQIGEKFCSMRKAKADPEEKHVMISYNWGHQAIVKEICSNLRNNGIKVWMDVDDMQGSTLQAMANAVEKAEIVLVCFSQKYKNSDNCRAEAEYAFQQKKKIVPLKMERGYIPDGWLGFIIGSKLFFDFGGKYPFENKMNELIKQIQVSQNTIRGLTAEVPSQEVKVQAAPTVQSQPSALSSVKTEEELEKVQKWTQQHVGKWLDKNKLPRNLMGRLSGIEVAFLHVLVKESPDTYYKTIGEQLGVKDILTMAKLRFALEKLNVNI